MRYPPAIERPCVFIIPLESTLYPRACAISENENLAVYMKAH